MSKVLVIGAGAIGAFYGAVLARAGCEVSVVARADFDAVAANGYRIESHLGDLSWRPAQVVRSAADYRGPADYLLVCLKLTAQTDPVALMRPAVDKGTASVFVANGIGIDAPIAAAFPDNELISGVAYAAVSRDGSGVVKHHSQFTRLVVGRYPAGRSEKAARIAEYVKKGGSSSAATDDIVGARWQKAAWNTVLNPVSAIGGGLGTQHILGSDESTDFVRQAMMEFMAVASAAGHPLPADSAEKLIEGTRKLPNYVSSMGQDRIAGRPMETEALLGNVVRIARKAGVSVPRLETLYALLRMAEQRGTT